MLFDLYVASVKVSEILTWYQRDGGSILSKEDMNTDRIGEKVRSHSNSH